MYAHFILLVSDKLFNRQKKLGLIHFVDSALCSYLAVITLIQITMSKSKHFLGQLLYSQVLVSDKLFIRQTLLKISTEKLKRILNQSFPSFLMMWSRKSFTYC